MDACTFYPSPPPQFADYGDYSIFGAQNFEYQPTSVSQSTGADYAPVYYATTDAYDAPLRPPGDDVLSIPFTDIAFSYPTPPSSTPDQPAASPSTSPSSLYNIPTVYEPIPRPIAADPFTLESTSIASRERVPEYTTMPRASSSNELFCPQPRRVHLSMRPFSFEEINNNYNLTSTTPSTADAELLPTALDLALLSHSRDFTGADRDALVPHTASSSSGSTVRSRKHGCLMCHKSFDRPSTLRKHLLVHTGEKAFACEICGHRFSVLSNLNRHFRKCAQKPCNNRSAASNDTYEPSLPYSSNSLLLDNPTSNSNPTSKRRRRISPPSPKWVPLSLRAYNLVDSDPDMCNYENLSLTHFPLPPVSSAYPPEFDTFEEVVDENTGVVQRVAKKVRWPEERNSWAACSDRPYHPDNWLGTLPGPAIPVEYVRVGTGRRKGRGRPTQGGSSWSKNTISF